MLQVFGDGSLVCTVTCPRSCFTFAQSYMSALLVHSIDVLQVLRYDSIYCPVTSPVSCFTLSVSYLSRDMVLSRYGVSLDLYGSLRSPETRHVSWLTCRSLMLISFFGSLLPHVTCRLYWFTLGSVTGHLSRFAPRIVTGKQHMVS